MHRSKVLDRQAHTRFAISKDNFLNKTLASNAYGQCLFVWPMNRIKRWCLRSLSWRLITRLREVEYSSTCKTQIQRQTFAIIFHDLNLSIPVVCITRAYKLVLWRRPRPFFNHRISKSRLLRDLVAREFARCSTWVTLQLSGPVFF